MVILELDNVYVKVLGLTKDQASNLWAKLSFKVEVFGMREVRYRHVFNKKTLKTYAGLIHDVIDFCKDCNIPYKVKDLRVKPEQNADYELVDKIGDTPLIVRPYQQEIIDRCNERETIQAATGAGKTFIMAGLIAKYKVSPVCVFADKITLCNQLKSEFEKFLGRKVGFIGDGIYDPQDITVMSIQSADEDLCKQAKMIMIDECLPANVNVLMSDGSNMKIGEIVRNRIAANVMTYNVSTGSLEENRIINYMEQPIGERKIYSISIKDFNKKTYNLMCTHNHKIFSYSDNKYIRTEHLQKDTEVILFDGKDIIHGIILNAVNVASRIEYVYDITVENNHNFFANNILVSNCHHCAADTCLKTSVMCKEAYYRIGVSATPWRDDGSDMLIEAILNRRNHENDINASKLIQLGYLVKPTIYFVPVHGFFKGKNYQDLYEKAIVDNTPRNKMVCKIAYQLHKRNRTILVLIKLVRHGEFLRDKLLHIIGETKQNVKFIDPKSGLEDTLEVANIEFLSGKDSTKQRQAVIEGVKQGVCKILIASTIGDEGLDLPNLDTLILAGAGKSSTRAFQRIGRVLRLYTGKTKAFVFDFDDETPMFKRQTKARRKMYETEEEWDIKEFIVNV